ncbi:MAG: rhomboid family intramembrane serine protease [Gammaproteobacteria bacterium]
MQNKYASGHPIFDLVSPAVFYLLVANVLIYMYQSVDPSIVRHFGLWPLAEEGRWSGFKLWQLVSHGFLHASNGHLLFNMFALWMFGTPLERLWGTRPFLLFYFVCLMGAALIQLWVGGASGPTIGASGAVFGLLMGFGMMYPNRKIMLIFLPIPIAAKYFVVLYGIVELTLGFTAERSTVAHFAHLGGMLFGLLLILYWRGKFPIKPSRQLMR